MTFHHLAERPEWPLGGFSLLTHYYQSNSGTPNITRTISRKHMLVFHHIKLHENFQKQTPKGIKSTPKLTPGAFRLILSIWGVPEALKLTAGTTRNRKKSRPMPAQKHNKMEMSSISVQLFFSSFAFWSFCCLPRSQKL